MYTNIQIYIYIYLYIYISGLNLKLMQTFVLMQSTYKRDLIGYSELFDECLDAA